MLQEQAIADASGSLLKPACSLSLTIASQPRLSDMDAPEWAVFWLQCHS